MTKAKNRKGNWWKPSWMFQKRRRKQRIAEVRARDGDNCWACGHPMVFGGAHPNKGRAATLEHVLARSMGGTDALANLRLAHAGCNKHLAANPPELKERMRQPLARKLFNERG
jgi:5-methylcytosine-specific restriction endonuclease McrA